MSVSMPPGFRLSPTSAAAIAGFPVDPWRGDGGTRGMQAVAAADIMAAASGYIYGVCTEERIAAPAAVPWSKRTTEAALVVVAVALVVAPAGV